MATKTRLPERGAAIRYRHLRQPVLGEALIGDRYAAALHVLGAGRHKQSGKVGARRRAHAAEDAGYACAIHRVRPFEKIAQAHARAGRGVSFDAGVNRRVVRPCVRPAQRAGWLPSNHIAGLSLSALRLSFSCWLMGRPRFTPFGGIGDWNHLV